MTHGRTRVIARGIVAAAATLSLLAPVHAQSAHKDLAFVSVRDGNREIYAMNADGSAMINLTQNPAQDDHPAWSPDGSQIAFDSDRTGTTEIFVMNADGSGVTQLTHDGSIDIGPRWSPDGTRIVFASNRDGNFQVYVIGIDGTGLARLTTTSASDLNPTWSHDGQQIAFRSDRASPGIGQMYVMNADGTNVSQITFGTGDSSRPNWSPDGTRIVFSSATGQTAAIDAIGADGSALTSITPGDVDDTAPAWSPDGTSIVFSSNRTGDPGICIAVVATSMTTCLTQSGDTDPDWSRVPTIPKRTPLVAWPQPGSIVLGTPLSAVQLDAIAYAPGTFTYTPATGTVLALGVGQQLSVVFTPDDPALYTTATAQQTLDVVSGTATPVGMFTGEITDVSTSFPLAGIDLLVYDATGAYVGGMRTRADGTYASPTLPPGTYFLRTFNNEAYLDELYDGIACLADCSLANGRPIAVFAGGTATGINVGLQKASSISGTVRDSTTGAPIQNVSADIFDAAGNFISSSWTNANGAFQSTGLPPGSYFARTSNDLGYQEMLFQSIACVDKRCDVRAGAPIVVGAPDQTASVDFSLDLGGRITGTVRDVLGGALPNVQVQVFNAGFAFVAAATTDSTGRYVTAGLPAGSYRARTSNALGYVDAVLGGAECLVTCDLTNGAIVTVAVGATTAGADFPLELGSVISGHVLSAATMAPLPGIEVDIYNASGALVARGSTAADGSYAVTGLPSGPYFARTVNVAGYRDQIYNGMACLVPSCNPLSGTAIVLTEGSVRGNVNLIVDTRAVTTLALASVRGTYSGAVTLSATLSAAGVPVANRTVSFTVNGASVGSAVTTTAGVATLAQVPLSSTVARTYAGGIGAVFGGDVSFEPAVGTADLTVTAAAPHVSWPPPASISYGTPLGPAQLNASADMPGTFVFRPPPGTVLPVGTGQLLTATFLPSDATDYTSVSRTTTIAVVPAAPPTPPTFQVLHSFTGADGSNPGSALTSVGDGSLFGTASGGGTSNAGVLYRVGADGVVTAAYAFGSGSNGTPSGGVDKGADGYFYGTTSGTAYRADSTGAVVRLRGFTGSIGSTPSGGLVQAPDGSFYGVATYGGSGGVGTLYRLDASSKLTVVHSFSWTEGAYPSGGLVLGADGLLYGTTVYGGPRGMGSVFRVDTSGALTVLHSFSWSDGAYPQASLTQGSDGYFYGTTSSGGSSNAGTVFRMDSSGNTTVLHAFASSDGATPMAGLIQASDGFFYGTTSAGGRLGAGTVFRMDASGAFATVHEFMWADGANSSAALTESSAGVFLGTASYGAANGVGSVFRMTRTAGVNPSELLVSASAATYGGTTDLSFVVSSQGAPLSGEFVSYAIDGIAAGIAITGADGVAAVPQMSVAGLRGGSHHIDASFLGDELTAGATASTSLVIAPGIPVLAWQPADLIYGTALGPAQLNASANIAGTFVYTPTAGTLLSPGAAQPISVLFTPADAANYLPASLTTTITVNKIVPHVLWSAPTAIASGTALDASQLNAVADVPGTFNYSPDVGSILPAGLGQTLSVTFTPADADHYAQQTVATTIDVDVPTPIPGNGQIAWEQAPGNGAQANIRFVLYVDDVRNVLDSTSCVSSTNVGMLTCSAVLPSIAAGTHRLELASFSLQDTPLIESARSRSLFVAVVAPVQSDQQ